MSPQTGCNNPSTLLYLAPFSTLIGHCVSTMCACRNIFWFSNDINPLSSANQDQSTTFTTANQSPKAVRYSFVCRRSRRPTEVSNPYKRLIRAEYRSAKLQKPLSISQGCQGLDYSLWTTEGLVEQPRRSFQTHISDSLERCIAFLKLASPKQLSSRLLWNELWDANVAKRQLLHAHNSNTGHSNNLNG